MRWVVLFALVAGACGESNSSSADGGAADGGDVDGELLVAANFTVPFGTRVEEFDFVVTGVAPLSSTDGREIIVAVRDASNPSLVQGTACPSSHPLDGCATVDYGAFGTTHDNRVVVDGAAGPVEMHLYVDRSIQLVAEILPPSE